jgi:diguanylate cyclase (GGDEF)-like protein/PAS domain S-box-containing protein
MRAEHYLGRQTHTGHGARRPAEDARLTHAPHAAIWAAIIGLAFCAVAFAFIWGWENALGQKELAVSSESHQLAVQNELDGFVSDLTALRALFESTADVTRTEFEIFTARILEDRSEVQNLSWVPRVTRSERALHELAAERDGIPGYGIKSVGADDKVSRSEDRDEYLPIFYSSVKSRTSAIYGIDLLSEPVVKEALDRARDGDRLSVVPDIMLHSVAGNVHGILFSLPVYRRGAAHGTVEKRRGNLLGFVHGAFMIRQAFDYVLKTFTTARGIDLYVFAAAAGPHDFPMYVHGSVLRTSPVAPAPLANIVGGRHFEGTLSVDGARWKLVAVPIAGGPLSDDHDRAWLVLAAAFLTSAAAAIYLYASNRHAWRLHAAMTETKRLLNEIEQVYRYAPVGLCLMDINYRYVRINEHMARINGLSADAHIGRTLHDVVPALADEIMELYRPIYERGEPVLNAEIHGVAPAAPDTQRHWLANFFPFRSESGKVIGVIAAVLDVSDLKQAQLALQRSEERFRTIFDSVNDLIFVHDIESGAFVEVNQRACERLGYTRDELCKLKITDLSENVSPYAREDILPLMEKARSGMPQTFEWRGKAKDGSLFWAEVSLRRAAFGDRDYLLATARDISQRKQAEDELKKMAQFDVLTGLANRGVFVANVDRAIELAHRGRGGFAVLYLDLDHFKDVNDTLGHPVGDRLLRWVAERLQTNSRAGDTVSRFGGDEFAMLMAGASDPTDAGLIADKLLEIVSKPYLIDGNEIHIGTSIGIAMYAADTPDAETLLGHADVALYRAKAEGRHTYRFFSDAMDTEVRKRVTLTSELRAGIADHQLFLMYQPQVDAQTGRIVGLEALVRWHHPTRGTLLPGNFVPEAERSGLIVALGNWVFRAACRQARQWLAAGITLPTIAINFSAIQFKAARELEKEIDAVLAETQIPPGLLEIELTETALMETSRQQNDIVQSLRARGMKIAIDDFGTGYSSLLYLRRFPVDRIKVAQEFIAEIGIDPNDTAIAKAAIGLARELGIEVIAEGVETAKQLRLLQQWGCRQAQGFYFAKPLPVEDVTLLLRRGTITHGAMRSRSGSAAGHASDALRQGDEIVAVH